MISLFNTYYILILCNVKCVVVIENPYIKERKDTSLARKMKSVDLFPPPNHSHNHSHSNHPHSTETDGSLPATTETHTQTQTQTSQESAEVGITSGKTKQQELLPHQSLDKCDDVESKAPEESSNSNSNAMFFDIVVSRTLAKPSIPLNYLPNSTQVLRENIYTF